MLFIVYFKCGVIECVPDCKSRDQLGKLTRGSLNDYFYDKFGHGDSQAYQKVSVCIVFWYRHIMFMANVCGLIVIIAIFIRQEPTLFTAWQPIHC